MHDKHYKTGVVTQQARLLVRLGVARGKRQYDKRQAMRKRDAERSMQRAIRHAVR